MSGKSAFIALVVIGSLLAPMECFAQGAADAGVSGIPAGPGSAGGLNNSVNDPSGIRNAPRPLAAPRIQVPPSTSNTTGLSNPAGLPPASYRGLPRSRFSATPRARGAARRAASRSSRAATQAVISAQDKALDRHVKSICKGC
jgi:hypothetical protein